MAADPAEGFGPHTTIPMDMGCLLAGRDPVAVDATACRMVGLDINSVEYFVPARERGLGNFDEDLITVKGKPIQDVYQRMWMPYMEGFHKRYMNSNTVCRYWVDMVRSLDIEAIVPQHGRAFIGRPVVQEFLKWIEGLQCGIDLMSQENYRVP